MSNLPTLRQLSTLGTSGAAFALALGGCAPEGTSPDSEGGADTGRSGNFIRADDPVNGEYIVVLNQEGARAESSVPATAQNLATSVSDNADVFATYESAIEGFAVTMSEAEAMALSDAPGVSYVEENAYHELSGGVQGDPPWGLDRIDQRTLPLSGEFEYDATGSGVSVYVIDSGILTTHEEFEGRIGEGFTTIDDDHGVDDCNDHGSHVAGTIGGSEFGVAKDVTLHPVRVFNCIGGGATTDGIVEAVDFVSQHADGPAVANMSLGGPASEAMDQAVENSVAQGITYAVAAGNDGRDACNNSPARVSEALTVGSTTDSDARSGFSSIGECVDIFAPGSDIESALSSGDSASGELSGTSMASPHVAGAAALYLEENPSATPAEVADALIENATADALTDVGSGSPNLLLYTGFIDGGGGPGQPGDPSVEITAPADGADVSGEVTVRADAEAGDAALEGVVFELPDGSFAEDTSAPYEASWDSTEAPDGDHEIVAAARDIEGAEVEDAVTVTVANGGGGGGGEWSAFDAPHLPTEDGGTVCTAVEVTQSGDASDVVVSLSGHHDWRSDLRATLSHGGTTQEVFGTGEFPIFSGEFSITERPVDGFSGDARGEWELCVEDTTVFNDEGVLEEWGVAGESEDSAGPWGASDAPNLPTEDGGTVCTSVEVTGSGDASTARVSLEGRHDWRSDLRATLSHGGQTEEIFGTGTFDRGAGSFSLVDHEVSGFSGDAQGEWELCVEDTTVFNDQGVLESWSVEGEG